MKKIELFVNAVQENRASNAIKTAIIKIAYINIGVAFFIFIFAITNMQSSENINALYQFYCIAIAIGMAYVVSEFLTSDKQDHYRMITVLMIAGFGTVLVPAGYATSYPLASLFLCIPIHYLMVISDRVRVKHAKFPQAVLDYFNRIIPVLFILSIGLLMVLLAPQVLIQFAQGLLTLTAWISSIYFVLIVIVAVCSFWILGIHGVGVIGTLVRPFWLHMMLVNGALILNKLPAAFIGSETFLQWCVWIGGSGCTIGLSILLLKYSKSSQMKTLGRDVFIPNLFNINENVVFGVPIVSNQHFKIPFFLAPIACALISFITFSQGWVTIPAIVAPWVLPAPIGILISTLGDLRSLILIAILILVSTLIYFPFFKAYDKELADAERN